MQIFRFLFILSLSLLPLLLSAALHVSHSDSPALFSRHGIFSAFPGTDVLGYHRDTISYLTGQRERMPLTLPLDSREISHMEDVRSITQGFLALLQAALLLSVILGGALSGQRQFFSALGWAGRISLGLCLFLLLSASLAFSSFFPAFHALFFADGSWIFPPDGMLVTFYPESFFLGMGRSIFLGGILLSLVPLLFSLLPPKVYISGGRSPPS